MTTKYWVAVERGDRYWIITVPEIKRSTQARTLAEVEPMARDLIALMTDTGPDDFDVEVDVTLPTKVRTHVNAARRWRTASQRANAKSASEMRIAAAELHESGMTIRDVGTALGVSHQRAHQLVSETKTHEDA